MRLKRRKTGPSSPPLAPPHLPHLFAPLGRHNLYTSAQRFGSSSLTQEQQKEEEKEKGAKTTAPRIPAWSPTVVLTRRHTG
jgi:hypothetical protein